MHDCSLSLLGTPKHPTKASVYEAVKEEQGGYEKATVREMELLKIFEACRQFLWQSAFVGLHSWGDAVHLTPTTGLLDDLEMLDGASSQERIVVHTAFVGSQFEPTVWSDDFRNFLEAIGRPLESTFQDSCAGKVTSASYTSPTEDIVFAAYRDFRLLPEESVHFVVLWNGSETPMCFRNESVLKTACGLSPSGWTFLVVVEPSGSAGLYRIRVQRNKQRLGPRDSTHTSVPS